MALNPGLMVQSTKGPMSTERNMDAECSVGEMVQCIKENLEIATSKDKELTSGAMVGCTLGSGKITRCTGKGPFHGRTGGSILETTSKIKRKDLESSHDQTGSNMKGCEAMGSSMELELQYWKMGRGVMGSGRKARGLNGLRVQVALL